VHRFPRIPDVVELLFFLDRLAVGSRSGQSVLDLFLICAPLRVIERRVNRKNRAGVFFFFVSPAAFSFFPFASFMA
jgi:hypothetical protein